MQRAQLLCCCSSSARAAGDCAAAAEDEVACVQTADSERAKGVGALHCLVPESPKESAHIGAIIKVTAGQTTLL